MSGITNRTETGSEKNLPKWAQAELQRLRANVEHYKQEAWSATTPGVSDTQLETYDLTQTERNRGLPPGATIKFILGPDEYAQCRVREHRRGEKVLEVMVQGGTAAIEPRAANVFYISAAER